MCSGSSSKREGDSEDSHQPLVAIGSGAWTNGPNLWIKHRIQFSREPLKRAESVFISNNIRECLNATGLTLSNRKLATPSIGKRSPTLRTVSRARCLTARMRLVEGEV